MIDRERVARALRNEERANYNLDLGGEKDVADLADAAIAAVLEQLQEGDAAAALARTKRAIEELAATLDEVDSFRDE